MPSLVVKTPPTAEPVSVPEAKAHLNVTIPDDDQLIQLLIRTCRTTIEREYDVAYMSQSLVLGRDYFPNVFGIGWGWSPGWWLGNTWMAQYSMEELRYGFIKLRSPVQSVTQVTYLDGSGASQVWASSNYILDKDSQPGRLGLALGKTYPTTAPVIEAVQIEFIAGATAPELVPDDWKLALKLYLGEYYENREQMIIGTRLVAIPIPDGVEKLMAPVSPVLLR